MTTVSNWDATTFFERLTDTNILARNKKFRFCKVSGLQGFEDALASMQTTTAFVCVSDTAEGYTELNNSPRTRRVKTVFFAMRHQLGNMAARLDCFDTMRELFRQYMSVLILEQTKLQERSLYLDPRIRFSEIPEYFASGCACASFQIAVDIYTDLRYNQSEWLSEAAQPELSPDEPSEAPAEEPNSFSVSELRSLSRTSKTSPIRHLRRTAMGKH